MGETRYLVKNIPIKSIIYGEIPPRRLLNKDSLLYLTHSIKEIGVIHPIVVVKSADKYELVSGERRLCAAHMAGLTKIPAIIWNEKINKKVLMLSENVNRENLHFFAESELVRDIVTEMDNDVATVSELLGCSAEYIKEKVKLSYIEESVKEIVQRGRLTEKHARLLLMLNETSQRENAAQMMSEAGLNSRKSREIIECILKRKEHEVRTKVFFGGKEVAEKLLDNTMKKTVEMINSQQFGANLDKTEKDGEWIYTISVKKSG